VIHVSKTTPFIGSLYLLQYPWLCICPVRWFVSTVDWSVCEARGSGKIERGLKRVTAIFDRYFPDVVVIQDTSSKGTRRVWHVSKLNENIAKLAENRGIALYAYSRLDVNRAFRGSGFANKQVMAELIAKHIPAFERYVPPPRKPWMSEDARMGLFDAAALALVFFQRNADAS